MRARRNSLCCSYDFRLLGRALAELGFSYPSTWLAVDSFKLAKKAAPAGERMGATCLAWFAGDWGGLWRREAECNDSDDAWHVTTIWRKS